MGRKKASGPQGSTARREGTMPIEMNRTFGIGRRGKCKKPFEKRSPNQKNCSDCSFYVRYASGRLYDKIKQIEGELKRKADENGNPKIYRAGEYSQGFLKSLTPLR